MITTALINVAYYILSVLVALFPTSTGFPTVVTDAFNFFGGYSGMLSPIIPMQTLGIAVAILISVELSILGFRGARWAISHLPFVGGRG